MKAFFLQTVLGLILSISGIQLAYAYVKGLDQNANILLLFLAIILIGIGAYFLMRAGKSDASVFKKLKNFGAGKQNQASLEQVLEKNNQLSNEWAKTVEKRDRLKMLEISTAAATEVTD